MKKTPNKPSAPPEFGVRPPVEWLDKHQAAEYCGISVSTLFYHHYTSPLKLLPPPTKVYGRLMWTKAQLDEFLSRNPTPGFKQRSGQDSVTLAEYVESAHHRAVNEGKAAYYKGQLVSRVERDLNHTRRYYIHLDNGQEIPSWNNARITLLKP